MNGFAVVSIDYRGWFADGKSALYKAHELLESKGIALVHNALKPNSTISDGGAPVFKADYRGILIDMLS